MRGAGADCRLVVDQDQIAVFAPEFFERVCAGVLRFQSERDQPLAGPLDRAERRDDIGRFAQFERKDPDTAAAGERLFRQFRRGANGRLVIARRRRADRAGHFRKDVAGGAVHLFGRNDRNDARGFRIFDFDRAGNDYRIVTGGQRRFGQRPAHPAARGV